MKRNKPSSELPEEEYGVHGHEKQVDEIVKALSGDANEKIAGVLVSGIPGIGKSVVAIQAGHRLDRSGNIVKYCSLRDAWKQGEEARESGFREILNVCAPDIQPIKENTRYVFLNWCRRLEYELTLILDDVDDFVKDLEFFRSFLKDLRKCSKCKIKFLITSRRSDITRATTGLNIQVVEVHQLSVEESIQVLKDVANLTSDTEPDAEVKLREIAELCENIPLALRLASPLITESEYSFEKLKQKIQENATKTLDHYGIMPMAFDRLEKPLKDALVRLSVFARSFDIKAAKALLDEDYAEYLLTKLKQRCLIQKQGNRYLIHLLIRSYAKQVGEGEEFGQILADGKQYYLRHFLSLVLSNAQKYWGKDSCKESLKLFNEERINLESVLKEVAGGEKKVLNCQQLEHVVNACSRVAPYIEDCVPSKVYDDFLNGLLQFSQIQGNITKQVEILCLLYDESRRRHGGDLEKSKRLIDLAIKLHDDNLPRFDQDSLSEVCYLSHYGRYLSQDCKKREEAQRFLKEAISIFEKETEEHSASTFDKGRVLSQMGHNERMDKEESEIRHEEALTCYQKALSFRKFHYGEHVVTALAHKDLADYYLFVKDFGNAEENYQAAVRIFDDLEMMKQKEAVPTYKNYGRCCEKMGKIEEARKKFEMGCDVADATIEGNHKWKVQINTYLALLLYKFTKESDKANELSENVFRMANELEMETWRDKEELETQYKRHQYQVTTV